LTNFEALRRRGAGEVAVLYAFDLIELDGSDLRSLPIETRKATLASLLRKPGALRLTEHIAADGLRVFAHACRLGAEGIVSKRLGSSHGGGKVRTADRVVPMTVAGRLLLHAQQGQGSALRIEAKAINAVRCGVAVIVLVITAVQVGYVGGIAGRERAAGYRLMKLGDLVCTDRSRPSPCRRDALLQRPRDRYCIAGCGGSANFRSFGPNLSQCRSDSVS
jgi:hypothetical protein